MLPGILMPGPVVAGARGSSIAYFGGAFSPSGQDLSLAVPAGALVIYASASDASSGFPDEPQDATVVYSVEVSGGALFLAYRVFTNSGVAEFSNAPAAKALVAFTGAAWGASASNNSSSGVPSVTMASADLSVVISLETGRGSAGFWGSGDGAGYTLHGESVSTFLQDAITQIASGPAGSGSYSPGNLADQRARITHIRLTPA